MKKIKHVIEVIKSISILTIIIFLYSCASLKNFSNDIMKKNINIKVHLVENSNFDSPFLIDIVPLLKENDNIVYKTNKIWFEENHLSLDRLKKKNFYSIELSPSVGTRNYNFKVPRDTKKIAVFVSYRNNLKEIPIIFSKVSDLNAFFREHDFFITQATVDYE